VTAGGERFRTGIQLRWGDMDSMAHINNAAIVTLLEEGRVRFLAEMGATEQPMSFSLVAARHEIDYLRPIQYRLEPVDMQMWIDRVGRASFTVAAQILVSDQLAVRAKTVVVAINPSSGGSTPLSTAARDALNRYLAD
jgi:acyl-CoA thioester hydrolase